MVLLPNHRDDTMDWESQCERGGEGRGGEVSGREGEEGGEGNRGDG